MKRNYTFIKFNEDIKDLEEFCKVNNRIPLTSGGFYERRLAGFMYRNIQNESVSIIRSKYIRIKYHSFNENIVELREFCKVNNRIPDPRNGSIESRLHSFMYRNKNNDEVKYIKCRYGKKRKEIQEIENYTI